MEWLWERSIIRADTAPVWYQLLCDHIIENIRLNTKQSYLAKNFLFTRYESMHQEVVSGRYGAQHCLEYFKNAYDSVIWGGSITIK